MMCIGSGAKAKKEEETQQAGDGWEGTDVRGKEVAHCSAKRLAKTEVRVALVNSQDHIVDVNEMVAEIYSLNVSLTLT